MRALSASWAVFNSAPVEEIVRAAYWNNETTFASFYLRGIVSVPFQWLKPQLAADCWGFWDYAYCLPLGFFPGVVNSVNLQRLFFGITFALSILLFGIAFAIFSLALLLLFICCLVLYFLWIKPPRRIKHFCIHVKQSSQMK